MSSRKGSLYDSLLASFPSEYFAKDTDVLSDVNLAPNDDVDDDDDVTTTRQRRRQTPPPPPPLPPPPRKAARAKKKTPEKKSGLKLSEYRDQKISQNSLFGLGLGKQYTSSSSSSSPSPSLTPDGRLKFPDFVKLEEKHGVRLTPWKHRSPYVPEPRSRTLVIGDTDAGKTTAVLGMIAEYSTYDRLWIIAKMSGEGKYDLFRREYFKDVHPPEFVITNKLDDIPPVQKLEMNGPRTIIIFDDFINAKGAKMQKMIDYVIMGRKANCQTFFLTQNFRKVPDTIRRNCNCFMIFPVKDTYQVRHMAETFSMLIPSSVFPEVLKGAHQEPHDFLFVDRSAKDDRAKFRRNATQILNLDEIRYRARIRDEMSGGGGGRRRSMGSALSRFAPY